MTDLVFSSDAVGFVSADQRYFALDRASLRFEPVDARAFWERFPPARYQPAEAQTAGGVGGWVLLRASNGREFTTTNAYCGEGEAIHHELKDRSQPISDHIAPCDSVSAVEIVGDQLWLGTRRDGEYGDYPAVGVVIQSLRSGSLVKTLGSEEGLAGNLVRVVRRDTHGGNVWVATERGFSEVDKRLEVVTTRYFFEDFDEKTGESTVKLSTAVRNSAPLAIFSRQLVLRDPKGFYEVVKRIPESTRSRLSIYDYHLKMNLHGNPNPGPLHIAFVPEEMNGLVPFFLEAAESESEKVSETALWMLCIFNDPRILQFFIDREQKESIHAYSRGTARLCIDKYTRLGLSLPGQDSDRVERMLERERAALEEIRDSRPDRVSKSQLGRSVLEAAETLLKMGNLKGIQMINEHFQAYDGNRRDASLFDSLLQSLYYVDEMTPTILVGLRKLPVKELYRACFFLNMEYEQVVGRRFDAAYAEALLIGLERVVDRPEPADAYGVHDRLLSICATAFKSQVGDSTVSEEFTRVIYPTLSDAQKNLADQFLQ
jgi:hypothetical protein